MTHIGVVGHCSVIKGFGKLDRPDKHGIRPTKYWIRLYRPIPMNQGIKQPVALGCEYLYLPTKHEGGY
jgi:hypothetical protein